MEQARVWVQEKLLADKADCGEVDRGEFVPRDACKRNDHEGGGKGHQGFNAADLQ